jgi:cysteine desulfurase
VTAPGSAPPADGRGIPREIYLDWNATAPPLPAVFEAMREAAEKAWANPSSIHGSGRAARAVVETARETIAALAEAEPRDVILTSGATESNNLALQGVRVLVTSRLEHPSVVRVAEALERSGRVVRWIPVGASGALDPGDVARTLAGLGAGFVVACMAANHETGVLQPIGEVARVVHEAGGRLHVDAAQTAGKLPPKALEGADTVSLAAHKLRGPKGIGALALRAPGLPAAVLLGGAQERGLRPGTVDAVAAAGFGRAAQHALDGGPGRYASLAGLRDRLEAAVGDRAVVNGTAVRLPHVANLSFEGWRGGVLVGARAPQGIPHYTA